MEKVMGQQTSKCMPRSKKRKYKHNHPIENRKIEK
jgi:hypothetical protein